MVKQADIADSRIVTELALLLWPEHVFDELDEAIKDSIIKGAIFINFDDNLPTGFAQCSLRNDYVEGTESRPVGYLEGIYVKEGYRMRGIAKELLAKCEAWAKSRGCNEFASDCEIDNSESLKFHLKAGFDEANRIICFTKKL